MEALLNQSRSLCPFLHKTSPTALRALCTPAMANASPGGGAISNLQVVARRCPVMSKALAVQSARIASTRAFSTFASGVAGVTKDAKALRVVAGKKRFHTSTSKNAKIDPDVVRKYENGEFALRSFRFLFLLLRGFYFVLVLFLLYLLRLLIRLET